MPSRISSIPENLAWKQAYMAAILEKDRALVMGLIGDARAKLSTRLSELTREPFPYDEVEAIHDADYMLQGLESSLTYRDDLQN